MPRPRFARLDRDKRQRILEAAAAEFAAHGFDQASLNHIIGALGLSKGVFYYYFDSKADLFGAVLEMAWHTLAPGDGIDLSALDRETFWPRLEALFLAVRQRVVELPWLMGVARLIYHPLPEADLDELVTSKFEQARAWMAGILERGQELGAVRADIPLDLLLGVLTAADQSGDHWLVDHWDDLDPDSRDRIAHLVFDMSRRLAAPPDAAGK